MRDFTDQLELRLMKVAARSEGDRRRGRPTARRATGFVAATACLAVALVVATTVGSRSSDALAYPVLSRPASDIGELGIAEQLRRDGADVTAARAIVTPAGTGYALPGEAGGLCLAVPDGTGGYGSVCSSAADIERHGLQLVTTPPEHASGKAPATFVVILPTGASSPSVRYADGSSTILAVTDGVASAALRDDATISYRAGADENEILVRARTAPSQIVAECNGEHGHYRVGVPEGTKIQGDPCRP